MIAVGSGNPWEVNSYWQKTKSYRFFIFKGEPVRARGRVLQNVVEICGEEGTPLNSSSKSVTIQELLQDTLYNFWIIPINQNGEMGAVLKNTVSTNVAGTATDDLSKNISELSHQSLLTVFLLKHHAPSQKLMLK